MVARAYKPDIEKLIGLGPVATGTMHALVCECVGRTLPTNAELAEAVRTGTQKEMMARIEMPRLSDFGTSSSPPTVADVRLYLAACCRRWITLLEEKP